MGLQLHTVHCICTSTSHFWTLFSESPHQGNSVSDPYIRLMVDVLLTMNEAFCIAGGGVSCFFAKNKADRGLVRKKHD
jgi:hypothetical protein